ncbi:putative nuclease HARBI1 [Papaver somniferum]|uniref:putative nuclease HARBI1 n=1 Tax=Papaver somniferum TaxID=3469 RepID=UPI000E703A92|nr:putative nuclease HARBI1 [Papaver somniferum]
MASSEDDEDAIIAVTAATTSLIACYYQYFVEKTICYDSILSGSAHVDEVLNGHDARCQKNFRMEKHVFLLLCELLQEKQLLRHSKGVRVEEKVAIFMLVVGHNERNRVLQERFQHSGETISRHFNAVLDAIVQLADDFLQPAGPCTPDEIRDNPRFYPYFKNCVGAIDGTHIPAMVSEEEQPLYRNRKGFISQNVLVACSFDLQFHYVLAGWEGSAHDGRVLDSALTRSDKLIVLEGKFYLGDAGFALTPSFITPYRGVRYHLKEYGRNRPKDAKELFNLRHSSLRNAVERIIGILKRRFLILQAQPQYPYESQVKIVLACCIIHNHIRRECINDLFLDGEDVTTVPETDAGIPEDNNEGARLGRNRDRDLASELRTSIADAIWNNYRRRRCTI